MTRPALDSLIVALDVESVFQAMEAVISLPDVTTFKIGHWLMGDPDLNQLLIALGKRSKKVFWDAKLYDIPQTVQHGVERAAKLGMDYVTVHGDPEILAAAVYGARYSNLKVLGVTVLSSMNEQSIRSLGYTCSLTDLLKLRIGHAIDAGCGGIVLSPNDLPLLSDFVLPPEFCVITPGVRLSGTAGDDHKRGATPFEAIRDGATHLVIGRPIIHATSPSEAVKKIIENITGGY